MAQLKHGLYDKAFCPMEIIDPLELQNVDLTFVEKILFQFNSNIENRKPLVPD